MTRREAMTRILAAVLCLGLAWAPQSVSAQQGDWKAVERQCMQRCPRMPRFSGTETNAEYKARMAAQMAHDQCKMNCARKASAGFPKGFTPISKSAADYYARQPK